MGVRTRAHSLYDRYIRTLPPAERLRLLALIASDLAAEAARHPGASEHEIMALYGLGEARGVGMDAQEYVQRLRAGGSVHPSEG